jgi:hypothetical protein
MTGQEGGFRAAAARFKSEVEAALTRARRAAAEAKEQSAEFRRGNEDFARRLRTGRLRGMHRDEVQPTDEHARAEAAKFRTANDLTVDELPDADELIARLPGAPAHRPPAREDEDFSQHTVLFDIDDADEQAPGPAVDQTSDGSIDSPDEPSTPHGEDDGDFSQQRILFDATVESYRPDPLPGSLIDLPDERKPS